MDYNKVEDAVFKKAIEVFKTSVAEFFGLDVNISHNQINNKSICQPIFHHPASANCANRPAMSAIHLLA